MPEKQNTPNIEILNPEEASLPMSGDSIIANPDVSYDTAIIVPTSVDEAWSGRFGITRMGMVGEGFAGPLLPQRLDPIMPEQFRSLPANAPEPKRLQVGDTMPDGHRDDRAKVVELDDEEMTMVFETKWTSKTEKPALHYTWQLTVRAGAEDNTAVILARTRMENVKHSRVGQAIFPRADRYAMRMIGEGVSRDDTAPVSRDTLKQRLGSKAILSAGKLKTFKSQRSTKH